MKVLKLVRGTSLFKENDRVYKYLHEFSDEIKPSRKETKKSLSNLGYSPSKRKILLYVI